MSNLIYTNTIGNLTSNISYDDCACSPREDNDGNVASFFFVTRSLRIDELEIDNSEAESWEDVEKLIKSKYGRDIALIKPVYMYKHSGVSLSYGKICQFDSGKIGYSVLLKSKIRKLNNIKKVTQKYIEKEEKMMDSELSVYSKWLDGDVYRVVILDQNDEEIENCGSFYGLNDAIEFSNEILEPLEQKTA